MFKKLLQYNFTASLVQIEHIAVDVKCWDGNLYEIIQFVEINVLRSRNIVYQLQGSEWGGTIECAFYYSLSQSVPFKNYSFPGEYVYIHS